jgi:hypothetical protein
LGTDNYDRKNLNRKIRDKKIVSQTKLRSEKIRAEGGGRRAEGGGRRAEGGGRRAEGGGQRAEGGGRRAEGGGWRAEGGGQRAEGRGRRDATKKSRVHLSPIPVQGSNLYKRGPLLSGLDVRKKPKKTKTTKFQKKGRINLSLWRALTCTRCLSWPCCRCSKVAETVEDVRGERGTGEKKETKPAEGGGGLEDGSCRGSPLSGEMSKVFLLKPRRKTIEENPGEKKPSEKKNLEKKPGRKTPRIFKRGQNF